MNRSFRCLMHVHRGRRLYHRLSWNVSLGQVLVFLFSSLWVVDEKAPSATVDDSDLVMEQNLILEVSELRQSTSVCFWCEQQLFASCLNQ